MSDHANTSATQTSRRRFLQLAAGTALAGLLPGPHPRAPSYDMDDFKWTPLQEPGLNVWDIESAGKPLFAAGGIGPIPVVFGERRATGRTIHVDSDGIAWGLSSLEEIFTRKPLVAIAIANPTGI